VAAAPAHAQLPLGTLTAFFLTPGTNAGVVSAVPGGGRCAFTSFTGPTSGACAGGGLTLSGRSYATAGGPLGAAVTFGATNNALGTLGYTGAFAYASASYTDALAFGAAGASAGPLSVTFRLAADGSSSVPNPPGAPPETPDALGRVAEGQYGILFGGQQYSAYLTGPAASSTTDFTVSVLPGAQQAVSFYLLALAGLEGDPLPLSGDASADFSHSMRVLGVSVRDATGRDLAGAVTVTSALGVPYAVLPASSVPEPATFASVALGVGCLGALAVRRRAQGPAGRA
jgi:hypothetical protein